MITIEHIKDKSNKIREEVVAIRRHIHSHPELSFQEIETAKFISQKLNDWDINHTIGVGGNGIVGLLQGKNPEKRVVALRAEMDALPITEKNEVEYKSKNTGVMHACGHDVHSSALLGVLKILNEIRNDFEGSVKFIFQPAEEKLPGGASVMIRDGVLENPKPDVIIAQHVFTPLKVGTAGFRSGMYMASADEIYITVKGKGGHAAEPHSVVNPIFIAANLLVELQKLISEVSESGIPTVLTFGKIRGVGATNVIPDEVTIDGTLRTMNEKWRSEIHEKLQLMADSFSERSKGEIYLKIERGYPCLTNDDSVTSAVKNFAEDFLGNENVKNLDIRMASEDFAYFSEQIPACFYRIGTGNPDKGITSGVHTSTFNIDEDALVVSVGLLSWITLNLLSEKTLPVTAART